jgi:hypothetical protein
VVATLEGLQTSKAELVVVEGLLESVHELAAKDFPQHRLGKKVVFAGANPVGVIEGKATGGNDTMEVGMKLDFLIPGVQHAEEADLGAEMLGITSYFEQCCAALLSHGVQRT